MEQWYRPKRVMEGAVWRWAVVRSNSWMRNWSKGATVKEKQESRKAGSCIQGRVFLLLPRGLLRFPLYMQAGKATRVSLGTPSWLWGPQFELQLLLFTSPGKSLLAFLCDTYKSAVPVYFCPEAFFFFKLGYLSLESSHCKFVQGWQRVELLLSLAAWVPSLRPQQRTHSCMLPSYLHTCAVAGVCVLTHVQASTCIHTHTK